jgi:insulysin
LPIDATEPPGFEALLASPSDPKLYRLGKLANGVLVLLVSDPSTELASVAVSVGVGSLANPSSAPGRAHFLEHMLFLGSEKVSG